MESREFTIRGVTHDANVAKIAVLGVPDRPGIAYKVFSALAAAKVDVDMIVQSIRNVDQNINDILFTIAISDLPRARGIIEKIGQELGVIGIVVEENVAKVSIVGAAMLGSPGIAANMFGALADANVNIEVISTSDISVSCLVKVEEANKAVKAIHDRFFPEYED